MNKQSPISGAPRRSVVVDGFTNALLDPGAPMLGPVENGGTIIANTAPGCWGPMITPSLRGGHEVTQPVHVDGAEPGDGIAIRIRDITVTALATASGHDSSPAGFCLGDPYVAARCPTCDELWPETHLEGIGQDGAVRQASVPAAALSSSMAGGYFKAPLPAVTQASRQIVVAIDLPTHRMTLERVYLAPVDAAGEDAGSMRLLIILAGLAYRLGGEEFVLLLRGDDAEILAERRRQAIPVIVANIVSGLERPVTASMGVADALDEDDFAKLYERADKLLYEAKSAGRNRTRSTVRPKVVQDVVLSERAMVG